MYAQNFTFYCNMYNIKIIMKSEKCICDKKRTYVNSTNWL